MADTILYVLLYISLFFEVFLLLIFIERREEIFAPKIQKVETKRLPRVTVMVPVFNEEKTVAKTLRSLLALSYPKEKLQIIVINDGSTDNTLETLKQFASEKQILVLSKENGGKHTALNLGLQHATGDIIGCLDADSYVGEDALLKLVPAFQDKEVMAVVPGIKIHEPKTIVQHIQAAEYMLSIFLRKALSLIGSIYVTPGPFSFFRKEVFQIVGPYREAHNTEDLEICLRMQARHMKIVNAHDAMVYTVSPNTVRKLYKQRVRWTYGFLRNVRDHYQSFFFRKEHGNLGLFVLPMATFSIYSGIYIAFSFVASFIKDIVEKIGEYMATGWYFKLPSFEFNWFFVNTSSQTWIALTAVALVFVMIALGIKMSEKRIMISRGLIYYGLLYGLLVPLWLTSAVIKAFLAKKPAWR